MITIGFYFLLRPGEHTALTADSTPFCLQGVEFLIGHQRFNGLTIPLPLLPLVTLSCLASQHRRMACGVRRLATAAAAILVSARSKPSLPEFGTSVRIMPQGTPPCAHTLSTMLPAS
jgi:hypothetical protein